MVVSLNLLFLLFAFLSFQTVMILAVRNDTIIFATSVTDELVRGAPMNTYTRLGLEAWERICNEEGGIVVGNKTYKVQLITVDHTEKGVEKTWEELVQDPTIDFFFPPFGSIHGETAAKITKNKILISASATRDSYIKNYKYTLSLQTAGEKFWRQPLIHLSATHIKTIAVIESKLGFSARTMCAHTEDLRYNDYQLTEFPMIYDGDKIDDADSNKPLHLRNYSIPFEKWNKKLQANLTAIAGKVCGFDGIVMCTWTYPTRPALMRLIKEECPTGENIPQVMIGSSQRIVPTLDEHWNYQLTVTQEFVGTEFNVSEQTNRDLKYLKEQINPDLTEADEANVLLGVSTFYSGEMLKYGIESAGTLDQDEVFEKIRTSHFDTAMGRYQWDASRLQERELFVIQHIVSLENDTHLTPYIGPFRLSNRSDFIYPIPTWEERKYPGYPKDDAEITFTVIPLLFILSSLILLVLLSIKWSHTVIRAASPAFMALMIVGSILLYASPLTFIPTLISQEICVLRFWLVGLGFVICVGAFVAKTWRIYALYSNKAVQVTRISDRKIWIIISILVTIETAILILLTVVGDLDIKIDQPDPLRKSTAEFDCDISSIGFKIVMALQGVYYLLLILYGSFLCVKLRNVRFKMYNETHIMAFSFYNLIFFAILVAIIQGVGMENNTEYIVSSSLILLGTAITIFSLFAQKLRFMIQDPKSGAKLSSRFRTGSKSSVTSSDLKVMQDGWKRKYEELSQSFEKMKRAKRKWKQKYKEIAPGLSEESIGE